MTKSYFKLTDMVNALGVCVNILVESGHEKSARLIREAVNKYWEEVQC